MTATDFLLWLQSIRNPVLTAFFAGMTVLGSEEFLIPFAAILYWCYNRVIALRVVLALLASIYLNFLVKDVTAVARPSSPLIPLYADTGLNTSSMPSGHSQLSATLWGTLAVYVRRSALSIVAVLLILMVGLSRLYFALHWPLDVLIGWLLGALFVVVTIAVVMFASRISSALVRLLAGIIVPIILFVLHPTADEAKVTAIVVGLVLGWWLERRFVGFESLAPPLQQIGKVAIGLVGIAAIRFGLKAVFGAVLPDLMPADAIRYFLTGLWAIWLAPAIFVWIFGRQQRKLHVESWKVES